jgi:hypothetical protein
MSYTYTDTTPNNNGLFTGPQTTATGYSPTYNTAGFAFARGYIGTTGTQAQFSNVRVTYTSATEATSQTITFDPLPDRVYGDAPFVITATASSGLPVSYTVVSGPATLSGNTVTVTGVGDVTIRASQPGDFTRLPALPVEQTFSVGKAPATVTLANLSHTYDGSAKSATVTTVPANRTVDLRYNGEQTAPYQIGSYEVTAVISDDNYEGSASGTLAIIARTSLENWRFTHFGTYENSGNAADSADPDHDNIVNLMEFALGLDPEIHSSIPAILVRNGNTMEYTSTRSKTALAEVSFIVEYSDSLLVDSWTNLDANEVIPPLSDDGTLQTVRTTLPAGSGSRRFVRLKVSINSGD